jgi:hypothetical protein
MLLHISFGINEIEIDTIDLLAKIGQSKYKKLIYFNFFSVTELLLVTITDKIASLILFTNCQLFEASSKSETYVLELNTLK